MPDLLFFVLFLGAIALAGGLVFLGLWMERKKREAFALKAHRLGLFYQPGKNHELAKRFQFINALDQGSNHYAQHCIAGKLEGFDFLAFEHHYQTSSSDSKGNRQVQHHYTAVYTVTLPKTLPELTIRREGVLSKIAQALGYSDIDFESAEFSRRYCVRARDKRFAYDVCHPLAMEFLLKYSDLEIEIEGRTLAAFEPGNLSLEKFEPHARRLLAFRRLLPEYLWAS